MKHFPFLVFVFAVAVLGFAAGGLVVLNQVFPYRFLYQSNLAAHALFRQKTRYSDPYRTDLWRRARTARKGVVAYDPERAFNGYTLYSSSHAQRVFLIDMRGRVVHQWHMRYSSFWDAAAEVRRPVPASNIFITRAYLYPDGDLLALYIGVGDTPWGYGLVKMDRDSHLLWKFMAHTHHDLDVGPDGRIYVLTHAIVDTPIKRFTQLKAPWIEDYVCILSPGGKLLERVALTPALLNSDYGRLLAILPWFSVAGTGDFLHTNAVQVITPEEAARFPYGKAGDVLVSFRELNTIAVLDPEQRRIVWALHGPWIGQHDPDLLPNGHIVVFDNNGRFGPGGRSRVVEFDPRTLETVWSYHGDKDHFFQSGIRGGEQRLPDGNTLITEEQAGTLLEVTPGGRVAWEFVNPARGGRNGEYIPVVSIATRIAPSWLAPGFLRDVESASSEVKRK